SWTVASGTEPQASGGETLAPSHVCSIGIDSPEVNAELVKASGANDVVVASVVEVNGGAVTPGGGVRAVRPSWAQPATSTATATTATRFTRTALARPMRSATHLNRPHGRGTRAGRHDPPTATS